MFRGQQNSKKKQENSKKNSILRKRNESDINVPNSGTRCHGVKGAI